MVGEVQRENKCCRQEFMTKDRTNNSRKSVNTKDEA